MADSFRASISSDLPKVWPDNSSRERLSRPARGWPSGSKHTMGARRTSWKEMPLFRRAGSAKPSTPSRLPSSSSCWRYGPPATWSMGCRLGSSSRSRRNAGASHSRWRWNTLPKAKGTKGWSWGWANLSKARWVRAWICWASLRKASPSAVRLTLRVVRWNKVAPSSFSREWICWVTAGWVT